MALFNFIYKNERIISSLYAQLFSGLLQSIEIHETSKERGGGSAEGGVPAVAKGGFYTEETNEKTHKETLSPHDAVLNDVLIKLKPSMKTELANTVFGDIVHLQGNLLIIPSEIEKNGVDVLFEMFVKASKFNDVPKNAQPAMKNFIKKALVPTDDGMRFFFKANNGGLARGVLQPEYMSETQSSLLYKYGNGLIPVQIVALQEEPPKAKSFLPNESILGGLHMLSGTANKLFLEGLPPSTAISPIALFYAVNGVEDTDEVDV